MNDRPIYTYHFADGKELTVGGRTLVMGILNVTPDSFSDGGRFDTVEKARAHMREMVADGAESRPYLSEAKARIASRAFVKASRRVPVRCFSSSSAARKLGSWATISAGGASS